MSKVITIHVEKLPEGVFLATSRDIQGLVAQGTTIDEALEIARSVATNLLELQGQSYASAEYKPTGESSDYPLVMAS